MSAAAEPDPVAAEEDDLEPRVGPSLGDAEAEAHGRPDGHPLHLQMTVISPTRLLAEILSGQGSSETELHIEPQQLNIDNLPLDSLALQHQKLESHYYLRWPSRFLLPRNGPNLNAAPI
ncbi:uncharacterized protein J3R85_004524 [Psidium guajava]|nr:uncharacterized protein J3R85_004524 [Psidium guajava]